MATRTQSTVVAVFRNSSDAQAAANDLRSSGFSDHDIYISSESASGDAVRSGQTAHHEGGITGWFKRVFGADDETDQPYYENAVRGGNVVLSVDVNDQNMDEAANILNRHSPVDVHRESGDASTTGAGLSAAGTTAAGNRATTGVGANQTEAIPVVEEQLKVGKRAVLRGGVRVYSRVVEQPVEEDVRLREERVRVERQQVDRPVTEADLRAGREQVIEVTEYAEEPVVSKEARVVEEVRVGKEASERTETVRDTVRHTEVNVENLGQGQAGTGRQDYTNDFRNDYTTRYGSTGEPYDAYAPSYQYGYEMANDPRYQGRNFTDVESDLRTDYARRYPNSTWNKVKDAVRYGWDRVTGKTSAANR